MNPYDDYLELLSDLPCGDISLEEELLSQICHLVKIILWVRCTCDGDLTDYNHRDLRQYKVSDLVGPFVRRPDYQYIVKEVYHGQDPFDLGRYIQQLLEIHEARKKNAS